MLLLLLLLPQLGRDERGREWEFGERRSTQVRTSRKTTANAA